MATTTPNYLWSVPTSSDLVKNGATAIETLGDSVDASLWSSGYGQAGKNKIINSDFSIWQRGTTFTSPAASSYTADRYDVIQNGTGTSTISQQAFTLGTAPVAGYESTYFLRHLVTAVGTSTVNGIEQRIESVRTFANQTVTFSFWAKADAARTISARIDQYFGTGGSPSASVTGTVYTFSATTAWTRFSQTITLASIAGKTIGTSGTDALYFKIYNANTLNSQMDIWGVTVEAGSVATPFQTASGGSPQNELAMCQRYYYRISSGSGYNYFKFGVGIFLSTTIGIIVIPMKVSMRTVPSFSSSGSFSAIQGSSVKGSSAPTLQSDGTGIESVTINAAATGATDASAFYLRAENSTSTYIDFSSEL